MTLFELLLILIVLIVVIYLVYYFFRGSSGKVALSRPMESRVDEYLDRRFEHLIEEWSLVRRSRLQRFKDERDVALDHDEAKIQMLKKFENELKTNLAELEGRLNALEDSLAKK